VLIWAIVGALVVGAAVYCYRVFSTETVPRVPDDDRALQPPSQQGHPARRMINWASAPPKPRNTLTAIWQAIENFWNPTLELRAAMELPRSAGRFRAMWKASWRWPVIWRRLVVFYIAMKLLDFGYFAVRGFETAALGRQQQIFKSGTKAFTPDESWGKPEEFSYEELIRRGKTDQEMANYYCSKGTDPRTFGLNFICR
jgi:hypothetical protein